MSSLQEILSDLYSRYPIASTLLFFLIWIIWGVGLWYWLMYLPSTKRAGAGTASTNQQQIVKGSPGSTNIQAGGDVFIQSEPGQASPKPGRFKETGERLTVVAGGNSFSASSDQLRQGPIRPIAVGDYVPIKAYIKDGTFLVDVTLYGGKGQSAAEVIGNEFKVSPPNWDKNSNDKALEIVNENKVPMLQVIYASDTRIIINGVFPHPSGLLVVHEDGITLNPPLPAGFRLKRIFKYPSWQFPGQYDQP